jgi:hypothetical protein
MMNTNNKTGMIGVISVLALLLVQSISHWSTIETLMSWLVSKGPAGVAVRDSLLSPWVPLVIAITALGLFWRGQRDKTTERSRALGASEEVPTKNEASVAGSGNSSATGGSASIGDIKIYTGDVAPPPVNPPREEARPPRLICTRCETIGVRPHLGNVWSEDVLPNAVRAVVATITNRVGAEGAGHAVFVKAQTVFYDEHGKESFHGIGSWLNHFSNKVDFPPGGSNRLLVALDADSTSMCVLTNTHEQPLPYRTRTRVQVLQSTHLSPQKLPVPQVCEITLLNSKGIVLGQLRVAIERGVGGDLEMFEVQPL